VEKIVDTCLIGKRIVEKCIDLIELLMLIGLMDCCLIDC